MKIRFIVPFIFVISAATACLSSGYPYIHNQFIPVPCCGKGPLPFAEIVTILSMDDLSSYFSHLDCDASELTMLPDFESEMAFAVVTGYCNDHHTSESRTPEGIVFSNDTFSIIIHSSSSVDSTRELPLGFCMMLITLNKYHITSPAIPLTVVMKDKNAPTAVENRFPPGLRAAANPGRHRTLTVSGRTVGPFPLRASGMVITTDGKRRFPGMVIGGSRSRK